MYDGEAGMTCKSLDVEIDSMADSIVSCAIRQAVDDTILSLSRIENDWSLLHDGSMDTNDPITHDTASDHMPTSSDGQIEASRDRRSTTKDSNGVGPTPAVLDEKRQEINVNDLEVTVDSLNKKVQDLLLKSNSTQMNSSHASHEPMISRNSGQNLSRSREIELERHVSGLVRGLDTPPATSKEDEEYEKLANRVEKIFQKEAERQQISLVERGAGDNPNSSYFNPQSSVQYRAGELSALRNIESGLEDNTTTGYTIESSHTGSIDANPPYLPDESMGSFNPNVHLVKEPHKSGIYSSNNRLNDSYLSTYERDYGHGGSLITSAPARMEESEHPTLVESLSMSVVSDSVESSFFRDMNDSLYSPDRDLRRSDRKKSPMRQYNRNRRSTEDLSRSYHLDVSTDEPKTTEYKPLSHYHPSARQLLADLMAHDTSTEGSSLQDTFQKFQKNRVQSSKTSYRDQMDSLSELLCNPVQYFTRQWLATQAEKTMDTFQSDTDVSFDESKPGLSRVNLRQPGLIGTQGSAKRFDASHKFGSFTAANSQGMLENNRTTGSKASAQSEGNRQAENLRSSGNSPPLSGKRTQKDRVTSTKGSVKSRREINSRASDSVSSEEAGFSRRTVSVQTPRELVIQYSQQLTKEMNQAGKQHMNGILKDTQKYNNYEYDLERNGRPDLDFSLDESTISPVDTSVEKRRTEGGVFMTEGVSLAWFQKIDKENQPKEAPPRPPKPDTPAPRGTVGISLQDAFLLNKADMLRRSRERLRGISMRAAERNMQAKYSKKSNKPKSHEAEHEKWKREQKRFAQVIPVSDDGTPRQRHITKLEMKARTEKLYKSLPEVQEKQKMAKRQGQMYNNRLMLDSYKAKLKHKSHGSSSGTKTLIVRHY